MDVTVRALAAEDFEDWLALWRSYTAFYKVDLTEAVTRATWERVTAGQEMAGFGARDGDGRLAGFVHYLFHPVTWSDRPRCYLEDLFVAEDSRRAGAGRALIEAVYGAADAAGADQVYWMTHEDNHAARSLYDRVGRTSGMIKYQR